MIARCRLIVFSRDDAWSASSSCWQWCRSPLDGHLIILDVNGDIVELGNADINHFLQALIDFNDFPPEEPEHVVAQPFLNLPAQLQIDDGPPAVVVLDDDEDNGGAGGE